MKRTYLNILTLIALCATQAQAYDKSLTPWDRLSMGLYKQYWNTKEQVGKGMSKLDPRPYMFPAHYAELARKEAKRIQAEKTMRNITCGTAVITGLAAATCGSALVGAGVVAAGMLVVPVARALVPTPAASVKERLFFAPMAASAGLGAGLAWLESSLQAEEEYSH